ncbi:hypothetical protein BEP19_05540 [Ammoniphilus oxalaticus]|uniref:Prepilin peptidase n=1 Tax=Ammoniphilus oxalaticus TaxID=66863 RepID=A0A419SIV7_9BACL|nr:A24 family peptidase [Ammoniphilus oxalaticus]RKD23890.1 hypothetical protein BEP19_05540 [Ammoniphilus oxalaticus]
MNTLIFIFITLLSLFLASFLNVVAIRIPKGESIVFPASHCVHCEHRLGPLDLIPVISFFLLKGRCRYCQAKVSYIYPVGEMFTASVLVYTSYKVGWGLELLIALPLMAFLASITISDLLYKIIPNKVNLFFFIYFMMVRLFYYPQPPLTYLIGMLVGGGLLLLIAIVSRGGMGGGDIKLMAVVGMALGWQPVIVSFLLASLFGGLIGVILLLAKVVKRKQAIPFGPFLAAGIFVTYFWGNEIILAYLNWILRS